jgi:pyruvate/2-oxoglutarate/acetoin dehydrogenase E1 component
MAMRGLRPVVEIMFGDFVTLIADQLINHIAKFQWMYGGGKPPHEQVHLPLVIRTPMGGRRGYGPTHSQSLEKLYLGVPGLRVLAPNAYCKISPYLGQDGPGDLLYRAIIEDDSPVLFIENKLLYLLPVMDESSLAEFDFSTVPISSGPLSNGAAGGALATTWRLKLSGAPRPALTIAAYGYMAELARQAALRLAYEHEIFTELIVPAQLAPFEPGPILASAGQTGRLIVVEEGTLTLGWGAEVLARAVESLGPRLRAARRIAALDLPIPASGPLEDAVLPGVEEIVQVVRTMI